MGRYTGADDDDAASDSCCGCGCGSCAGALRDGASVLRGGALADGASVLRGGAGGADGAGTNDDFPDGVEVDEGVDEGVVVLVGGLITGPLALLSKWLLISTKFSINFLKLVSSNFPPCSFSLISFNLSAN